MKKQHLKINLDIIPLNEFSPQLIKWIHSYGGYCAGCAISNIVPMSFEEFYEFQVNLILKQPKQ